MKKLVVSVLVIFISIISCNSKIKNNTYYCDIRLKKDSLELIKDTVIFGSSAEGEQVKLYKNKFTDDSIIIAEALGESGKAVYKFIFNKKIIKSERSIYNYKVPIYQDLRVEIKDSIKENLNTSPKVKNDLTDIFNEYHIIFVDKTDKNILQKNTQVYRCHELIYMVLKQKI